MGTTVRPYRDTDRAACLAVFDSNVPDDFRAEERAEFAAFLDDLPGPYLVLVDGEERVAACGGWALETDGESAAMCWGMVRRDRQGEGWGRRLLEERVRRAGSQPGVRRLILTTSQRTRGFFERLGFRVRDVVPDGIAPGLDRVEMERAI